MKILFAGLFFVSIVFHSCHFIHEETFDKVAWNTREDPAFPPSKRDAMLKELTANHKLAGLKYDQLTDTLGAPDFEDSVSLTYIIKEDYSSDIDPVYSKGLVFYFSKTDSIISSFKIREWKK